MKITDIFSPDEDDEGLQELTRNKNDIVNAQKMVGIVKKRGTGLKKYWYKYYCCLLGGYLYFYETNNQKYPSSYFYLKNTEVIYGIPEIGIENTLILRNKSDQCYLAFHSNETCQEWKLKIDEVVKEISILSEKMYKRIAEEIDLNDVLEEAGAKINKMIVECYDENIKKLVEGVMTDMECNYIKRCEDLIMKIKIFSFELFHPDNQHYKKIIYNDPRYDLLNLSVKILTHKSPYYKGQLLIEEVELGHIIVYYPPKLIKEIMKFIETDKKETNIEEERKGEVLNSLNPLYEKEESLEKINTCLDNKDVLLNIICKFKNFQLYCLHPAYDTLFILFSMDTSVFEYSKTIDHDFMHFNLGYSVLSDLTNYPNTILPMDYCEDNIKSQILLEMQSFYSNGDACLVEMISYSPQCPERPLTTENLSSKLRINFWTIKFNFYNEYLVTRFSDYFIYSFLDSLSSHDRIAENMEIYHKKKKPYINTDYYDIVFLGTFTSIDLKIEQPQVYLRPKATTTKTNMTASFNIVLMMLI